MIRTTILALALCFAALSLSAQIITADLSSSPTRDGSYNKGFLGIAWNSSLSTRLSASYAPAVNNAMNVEDRQLDANKESETVVDLDAVRWDPSGSPLVLSAGLTWRSSVLDQMGYWIAEGSKFTSKGIVRDVAVLYTNSSAINYYGPRVGASYAQEKLFGQRIRMDLSLDLIPVFYYNSVIDRRYDFIVTSDGTSPAAAIPSLTGKLRNWRFGYPIAQAGLDLNLFSWVSLGVDYVYQNVPFAVMDTADDFSGITAHFANYGMHDLSFRAFLEWPVMKGAVLKLGAELAENWIVDQDALFDSTSNIDPMLSPPAGKWRILFGFSLK
jgi:hypothetical protein